MFKNKKTEQEIKADLGKIESLNKDNLSSVKRSISKWITNGNELNTTFRFGTNFKDKGKFAEPFPWELNTIDKEKFEESFPWEFSLLEWIGRFGDTKELSSLVKKGLDPKFKCGGRSAFQVVMQSSELLYGGHITNIIKSLLDVGVEKNINDPSGRTPLEYLLHIMHLEDTELKKLHIATHPKLPEMLKGFLTADGIGYDEISNKLSWGLESSAARMKICDLQTKNAELKQQLAQLGCANEEPVKITLWNLQTENAALRQRVAQLECEKEELVKTTLTEAECRESEPQLQR